MYYATRLHPTRLDQDTLVEFAKLSDFHDAVSDHRYHFHGHIRLPRVSSYVEWWKSENRPFEFYDASEG